MGHPLLQIRQQGLEEPSSDRCFFGPGFFLGHFSLYPRITQMALQLEKIYGMQGSHEENGQV